MQITPAMVPPSYDIIIISDYSPDCVLYGKIVFVWDWIPLIPLIGHIITCCLFHGMYCHIKVLTNFPVSVCIWIVLAVYPANTCD